MAEAADAEMVADFLGEFFHRSIWAAHLNYRKDKTIAHLRRAIGTQFAMYVIAMDKDEMVGVCSYHVFDVFSDPMAVMDETYTIPKYQKTDLGRRLVDMVITLARNDGCKVINFPICSGMPEQNSLMNMVGRHFGAEPVGMIFRKVL
jgi:GNAT superfamily N-acetyltransferase